MQSPVNHYRPSPQIHENQATFDEGMLVDFPRANYLIVAALFLEVVFLITLFISLGGFREVKKLMKKLVQLVLDRKKMLEIYMDPLIKKVVGSIAHLRKIMSDFVADWKERQVAFDRDWKKKQLLKRIKLGRKIPDPTSKTERKHNGHDAALSVTSHITKNTRGLSDFFDQCILENILEASKDPEIIISIIS